jgi:hypothetical protein
MVTHLEAEAWRFYRLYSIDLEGAKQTIQMLKRFAEADVRYAILRDAIVAYARPFSKNRGRFLKHHRLSDAIVPREFVALHAELITLRDRAFAHTDHDFRNPQLIRWPLAGTADRYVFGFSNPPWESLNRRAGEIEQLIAEVESAVNAWVSTFERQQLDPLLGE